jgi:uncharacterized protein YybS (DUF2232 family)
MPYIVLAIYFAVTLCMSKNESEEMRKAGRGYIKYSAAAFQMLAVIGLSVYAGLKLDDHFQHELRWITALLGILGVILAIYFLIKQLNNER